MEPKRLCPHCAAKPLPVFGMGENVVAIIPCPCNDELLLYFRDNVLALKRSVLESGTFDERKEHLGTVAARILELAMQGGGITTAEELFEAVAPENGAPIIPVPITVEEMEKFVRINLRCLDNSAYFKRHFGK